MKKNSRTYLEIFLISILIFCPKWICSYYLFPNEELLIKTLLDVKDVHYFLNVISLSNFDLTPSFNEFIEPKKIITFPFFSVVIHSLFYKVIGYYSFIILELLFIFFSILIFFKILQKLELNKNYSLFVVTLYFSLPFLMIVLNPINFSQVSILQNLVVDFIGLRFPRPLVTNIFFLLGIYFLIKLQKELIEKKVPKSIISISIVMALQVNSFFYFFLIQGISTITLVLMYKKNKLFDYISNHKTMITKSLLISCFGLTIFLLQSFVGEGDYSKRIGVVNIDFKDKIFLIKYFFSSLLRSEVIFLIVVTSLLFFYTKKISNHKKNQINLFIIIIISSFFSAIFFIFLSNKEVSSYHFANIFLFFFVLFIFILIILIINNLKLLKYLLTKYRFLFYFIIFFLGIILNFSNLTNKVKRQNYAIVNNAIKELKSNNTELYLFTNDLKVQADWLFNGFNNIYLTNGFNNSLNDNQIELAFSKVLKSIFKENSKFEEIIEYKNKKDDNRNSIISYFFNYKYQANSFHVFSNKNDFSLVEQKRIKETSPLRSQTHILPISEKKRIIKVIMQQNNKIDVKKMLIIIDKNNWPENFNLKKSIKKNSQIITDNKYYFIARINFI